MRNNIFFLLLVIASLITAINVSGIADHQARLDHKLDLCWGALLDLSANGTRYQWDIHCLNWQMADAAARVKALETVYAPLMPPRFDTVTPISREDDAEWMNGDADTRSDVERRWKLRQKPRIISQECADRARRLESAQRGR
jgi:hypothetical protein